MDKRLVCLKSWMLASAQRRGKGWSSILGVRVRLFGKALLSWAFQRRRVTGATTCDVLLIHPSQKSFLQGRKRPLIAAMRARGLRVEEFVEGHDRELWQKRCFATPGRKVPFLLRWYAAHAAWLLQRYQARIILTERNAWIVPSFIKVLRDDGAQVVHLAHSVPTSQSRHYQYFDYDYYLIFGQSSHDYLTALPGAFGQCISYFAGPYFFHDRGAFPSREQRAAETGPLCLFLCPGPDYETSADYRDVCLWVRDWLAANRTAQLWVKVHPRGQGVFWREYALANEQIHILPRDTSLEQCAARFDLALSGYTNAIIDIARYDVPFVLLGNGEDFFFAERFGMRWARNAADVPHCIEQTLQEHEASAKKHRSFSLFMFLIAIFLWLLWWMRSNVWLPVVSLTVSVWARGDRFEPMCVTAI